MARAYDGRISIDIGTGDGRAALARAGEQPDRLVIGVDAAVDGLKAASSRAGRGARKGGVANAMFVQAAVESLPCELVGMADEVTITLPWGSLLQAALGANQASLCRIRSICRDGAVLKVVFSIDQERDAAELSRLKLDGLVEPPQFGQVRSAYHGAGFF